MFLEDGTVIPSYLTPVSTPRAESKDAYNNPFLRYGEVIDVIYPDDKRSLSKSVIEYSVQSLHMDHLRGGTTTKIYPHCILLNPFAGLADKGFYTLRVSPSRPSQGGSAPGLGSKVLMLCVNGAMTQPIIIGGVHDQKDLSQKDASKQGRHLNFVFNGVGFDVNDSGEFTVTYGGKTKMDGTLDDGVDKNVVGTTIQMLKDGSVLVKSPTGQLFNIDQTNKTVKISGKDKVQVDAEGSVEVKAGGAALVSASKGLLLKGGNAGANGAVVGVGDATDFMVKGTTYRASEAALHTTMRTALQIIATAFQSAGATASAAVSPATTTAGVVALGAAITLAGTQLATLAGAIGTFEGKGSTYLSTKNKND